MVRVRGWRWVWGVMFFCAAMAMASYAQDTFTTLAYFNGPDGTNPQYMVPTQGFDGNFYGTAQLGGTGGPGCTFGCGTVFRTTPQGNLTTLYDFCSEPNCADGSEPLGSLIQASDGELYGTTADGGVFGEGTVFKITAAGKLTTLYSFCALANCADGQGPYAGLVQATNGNFYGTTTRGSGTIFEITPAGKLTTLSYADFPSGTLVQGRNGNFYGENEGGEGTDVGSIFEVTAAGKVTTLFRFGLPAGAYPNGGLIQGINGDFYGVTYTGGNINYDSCPNWGCGTVFEMTPAGKLTTLYNFCAQTNCADGAEPMGPLVQATDGNFYGATMMGGFGGNGTLFEITPGGTLTTLHTFCTLPSCPDGFWPFAGLLQATNGSFYGTTYGNNTGSPYGTLFNLSTGLGPFVKTQPTSAKEGAAVGIFGQGFTNSSIVQFGGVQATSVKLSGSTFLTARVPAGALTGPVIVTTATTTLTSNQPFRVTPQVLSFNPPSGSVGTEVTITGTGLTQTSGVGFGDNVPAQFTVNSDTQITATVPTGAKTGPVGVVTKGGTAISSATFTVN